MELIDREVYRREMEKSLELMQRAGDSQNDIACGMKRALRLLEMQDVVEAKEVKHGEMKKKYAWTRRKSDDIWHGGICNSVKECVEEAKHEGYKDTDTFAVGYAEPYEVNYVNSDLIIEYLQEQAFDEIGECAEGWLDSITKEQREDLENRVLKVVLKWLKDCKEEPTFYKVDPFDELTLQEALEKYAHPTEKGGAE